jgi:hypothetical protein|tara:strand:+ start:13351 stop:13557 length:207 start_codon:yes stop_codon:yes gene_type:complete
VSTVFAEFYPAGRPYLPSTSKTYAVSGITGKLIAFLLGRRTHYRNEAIVIEKTIPDAKLVIIENFDHQ